MSENEKQTELEQLIKVELLGIITRIAELAAKNIIDANQQEFINSLKSVINHQIAFAWEVTKLLNDLEKSSNYTSFMVNSSITAKPFFEKMGYKETKKNCVHLRGQNFVNFTLKKVVE